MGTQGVGVMKVRNNIRRTGENWKAESRSALDKGIRLKGNITASELSAKVQELIALAVAITSGGEALITGHVHSARCAGATHGETVETVHLAVRAGGEATAVNGNCALEALKQFDAAVHFYQKLAETALARRTARYTPGVFRLCERKAPWS